MQDLTMTLEVGELKMISNRSSDEVVFEHSTGKFKIHEEDIEDLQNLIITYRSIYN